MSIFPDSKITEVSRYTDAGPMPEGAAMVVAFELDGSPFLALNGGPDNFKFDESISFSIDCADQEEVDYFWNALSQGGGEIACGWLYDKYGLVGLVLRFGSIATRTFPQGSKWFSDHLSGAFADPVPLMNSERRIHAECGNVST